MEGTHLHELEARPAEEEVCLQLVVRAAIDASSQEEVVLGSEQDDRHARDLTTEGLRTRGEWRMEEEGRGEGWRGRVRVR